MLAGALLHGCAALETDRHTAEANGHHAYRLEGKGAPAVVFQSGLGDGADVWAQVLARAAHGSTAIAYDRFGYGGSSPATGARDPCAIAREQRTFLRAAGVPPPYVLVGHSLGGLYQYAYARLFPEDVAALVLVDPTHPEHWARMQSEAPAMATMVKGMRLLFGTTMGAEFDDQSTCLDRLESSAPVRAPVRLLVRSTFPVSERGGFEAMARRLQIEWLALSGAPRIEPVPGAGHYIQRDRPDAVAAAIDDLIRRRR